MPSFPSRPQINDMRRSTDHILTTHVGSLARPRNVLDTFAAIFGRKIALDEQGMATGEALAHLNCLIYRGEVKAEPGPDGVTLYSLAS